MQVEYLLFASNLIGFLIHKVLSLEQNFLSEHCIVVFGHSTPSLQMCTASLGIWIRARQEFNGRTISDAAPCLHPQRHTHTLCHIEKWASSGYRCQAPLGFTWMGASLFLPLSLPMDYLSGTPPQQGRLMPLSHWTSYFACILQSLAIPAPVRCNIYTGETFQRAGCLSCSVTDMSFRPMCRPDFNHCICFIL